MTRRTRRCSSRPRTRRAGCRSPVDLHRSEPHGRGGRQVAARDLHERATGSPTVRRRAPRHDGPAGVGIGEQVDGRVWARAAGVAADEDVGRHREVGRRGDDELGGAHVVEDVLSRRQVELRLETAHESHLVGIGQPVTRDLEPLRPRGEPDVGRQVCHGRHRGEVVRERVAEAAEALHAHRYRRRVRGQAGDVDLGRRDRRDLIVLRRGLRGRAFVHPLERQQIKTRAVDDDVAPLLRPGRRRDRGDCRARGVVELRRGRHRLRARLWWDDALGVEGRCAFEGREDGGDGARAAADRHRDLHLADGQVGVGGGTAGRSRVRRCAGDDRVIVQHLHRWRGHAAEVHLWCAPCSEARAEDRHERASRPRATARTDVAHRRRDGAVGEGDIPVDVAERR